jgi:hypothetical protein
MEERKTRREREPDDGPDCERDEDDDNREDQREENAGAMPTPTKSTIRTANHARNAEGALESISSTTASATSRPEHMRQGPPARRDQEARDPGGRGGQRGGGDPRVHVCTSGADKWTYGARASATMNVEPSPSSDSTEIVPPIWLTSSREM